LRDYLSDSCVDLVIVRPSLVYGPGCPGNLRNLLSAVDLCLPFPFRLIDNSRSFLSLDNLVSAVQFLAFDKRVSGHSFVLSDQEHISTPDLLRLIASVRNRKLILLPFPLKLFKLFLRMPFLGRKLHQLTSSLIVDSSKLRVQFGWSQPFDQLSSIKSAFKRHK